MSAYNNKKVQLDSNFFCVILKNYKFHDKLKFILFLLIYIINHIIPILLYSKM